MRRWEGGDRPYSPQFARVQPEQAQRRARPQEPRRAWARCATCSRTPTCSSRTSGPASMARLGLAPADLVAASPAAGLPARSPGSAPRASTPPGPATTRSSRRSAACTACSCRSRTPRRSGPGMSDLLSGSVRGAGRPRRAARQRSASGRGQRGRRVHARLAHSTSSPRPSSARPETGEVPGPGRPPAAGAGLRLRGLRGAGRSSCTSRCRSKFWHGADRRPRPAGVADGPEVRRPPGPLPPLRRPRADASRTVTRTSRVRSGSRGSAQRDIPHGPMNTDRPDRRRPAGRGDGPAGGRRRSRADRRCG